MWIEFASRRFARTSSLIVWLSAAGVFAQAPSDGGVPDADLPSCGYAVDWESPAEILQIDVGREGATWLDGRAVSFDELVDGMRERAKTRIKERIREPGRARQISSLPVLLRAHRDVPAIAIEKVFDACEQPDVGLWKVNFAVRGSKALPQYLPLGPPPKRSKLLRVGHAVKPSTVPIRDVLAKVEAIQDTRIRVIAAGNVSLQQALAAIDIACEAGASNLQLEVWESESQEKVWATHQLEALVDVSPVPSGEPHMRLQDDPTVTPDGMWNSAIGLGGAIRGPVGGRMGGRRGLERGGRVEVARSIERGLEWLVGEQGKDGSWPGAGSIGKVGSTALALLALVGDGSSMRAGPHKDAVRGAAQWLRGLQDPKTGRYSVEDDLDYEQELAALAMIEVVSVSRYKLLNKNAQLSIDYLATLPRPTDPAAATWRDEAFRAAKSFRVKFDADRWKAERVDVPEIGEQAEFLAVAAELFGDLLRSEDVEAGDPRVAEILARRSEESLDPRTWYFASHALYQVGGEPWRKWSRALIDALPEAQVSEGEDRGAWGPVAGIGPIGTAALMCLSLESFYRYSKM